jgi:hypothetical protein
MDLCNKNLTYKSDFLDKNNIERGIKKLLKIKFIERKIIFDRSLFTISYPEIINKKKQKIQFETPKIDVIHTSKVDSIDNQSLKKCEDTSIIVKKETKMRQLQAIDNQSFNPLKKIEKRQFETPKIEKEKNKKVATCETTYNQSLKKCEDTSIIVKKETKMRQLQAIDNQSFNPLKKIEKRHKRRKKNLKETIYTKGNENETAKVETAKVENFDSFLLEKKYEILESLWKFVVDNRLSECDSQKNGIKHKDLIDWLKKYEQQEILSCLQMVVKATITKSYAGYVTRLLQKKVVQKEIDAKLGREFVEDFIQKNNVQHIELKKSYFTDLTSNEQIYYWSSREMIQHVLHRSFERAREFAEDG